MHRASGESAKEAAKRLGISASTAYLWMKRARVSTAPRFARLLPAAAAPSQMLVIEVGGAAIRISEGFDAELLLEVVAALGRPSA